MALLGLILLFALLGVGSAGAYFAGKLSTGSSAPSHRGRASGSSVAVADVARAQAQATAIVKAAQDASGTIVKQATRKARRQANVIIATAHRRARAISAAAPAPVTSAPPATGGITTAPGSGASTGAGIAQQPVVVPTAVPLQTPIVSGTTPSTASGTTPNLSGVPASWLVVGYNATFGSGPGSAGSISVINRSGKVFSGVATVRYSTGALASASFSGLAPGQSEVLPLNGPAYPGGGYVIGVNVH